MERRGTVIIVHRIPEAVSDFTFYGAHELIKVHTNSAWIFRNIYSEVYLCNINSVPLFQMHYLFLVFL